jgi:hypothetical protein
VTKSTLYVHQAVTADLVIIPNYRQQGWISDMGKKQNQHETAKYVCRPPTR